MAQAELVEHYPHEGLRESPMRATGNDQQFYLRRRSGICVCHEKYCLPFEFVFQTAVRMNALTSPAVEEAAGSMGRPSSRQQSSRNTSSSRWDPLRNQPFRRSGTGRAPVPQPIMNILLRWKVKEDTHTHAHQ